MAIGAIFGQESELSDARGVAVDADGNFVVAGSFQGTLDFDPGPGRVAVESPAGSYFLARYDEHGELLWVTHRDESSSGIFDIIGVAVDSQGSSYAVGNLQGTVDFDPGPGTAVRASDGNADYVAKFDADGEFQWAVGPEGTGLCGASAVAVDADDNVVITGFFNGALDFDPGPGTATLDSGGNQSHYVAKYDGDGELVWATSIDSISGGTVYSYGVTTDEDGNVFATGYVSGSVDFDPGTAVAALQPDGNSHFLARYDADGDLDWVIGLDTGQNGSSYGYGVATDGDGNSVVVGSFSGTVDFDPGAGTAILSISDMGFFVAKYDTDGELLWVRRGDGKHESNYGNAVAVDGDGNVHVTGVFGGDSDDTMSVDGGSVGTTLESRKDDFFVVSYDSDGTLRWAKNSGVSSDDETARAIDVDSAGNIFLTGNFTGTVDFDPGPGTAVATSDSSVQRFFTAFYSADGSNRYLEPAPLAAPEFSELHPDTGDHLTADTTPALEGTAEALSTVHILRDGVEVDTVLADADGEWSWIDTSLPGFGTYAYTAFAALYEGYESPESAPFDLYVTVSGGTAGNGADLIAAGSGKSSVDGKNGDDTIFGEAGNDTLKGGNGNDRLFGGSDNDALWGGAGDDTAKGDGGNDTLYGEAGADRLSGDAGDDRIEGGAGGDALDGGNGKDTLYGGDGTDTLTGGAGADRLYGDAMGDWIVLGNDKAKDTVQGPLAHLADDTILGFDTGTGGDVIAVTGLASKYGKLLDGLEIEDGVLSLAKAGGGTITFDDIEGTRYTDTMLGSDGSILVYIM